MNSGGDKQWSPIQTRRSRKLTHNPLSVDNATEDEDKTERNTLEFVLNNSKAIKKKRMATNREKFKGMVKDKSNIVLEFSTAILEMVHSGIKTYYNDKHKRRHRHK